ncbi:MAG: hypothetical protein PVG14_10815, partial [Anaerolineales bacterium]
LLACTLVACGPQVTPQPETDTISLPASPTPKELEATATATNPLVTETATEIAPTETPLSELEGPTSTYQDEHIGFALEYPADWHLVDVEEEIKEKATTYSATLSSWQPSEGGTEGIPEGGTKVDITVIDSGAQSLEEAVAIRKSEMEEDPMAETILSEEEWDLSGGLKAMRWQVESDRGQAAVLITALDGYTLLLSGLGDFDLFDQVARTLQRADTAP